MSNTSPTMVFTVKQVASMQAERNNFLYLLRESALALEHFPDEQYGSKTVYKSKQLLQLIENAIKKYGK